MKNLLVTCSVTFWLFIPLAVTAEDGVATFTKSIPFLGSGGAISIEAFTQALYQLAIAAAAFLVVVKLILAGSKYIFSEVVTSKEDAKADIRASIIGLLIILAAVTLLNTINPELTKLNFLRNAPVISPSLKDASKNSAQFFTRNFKPGQSIDSNKITSEQQLQAYKESCEVNGGVMNECTLLQCLFGTNGWYCEATNRNSADVKTEDGKTLKTNMSYMPSETDKYDEAAVFERECKANSACRLSETQSDDGRIFLDCFCSN